MQNGRRGRTLPAELSADLTALTGQVIGCAIHVHKTLGPGFLESIYVGALARTLLKSSIPFVQELRVPVEFEGELIGAHRLDLLIGGRVVVELKAVERLQRVHYAQVRSYLRATKLRTGLLLNFNSHLLDVRRILNREGGCG